VELALVLPLLLLLVLGMVQVGAVLSAYLTLQAAAEEGARVGITGAPDSAIVARVEAVAADLNPSNLTVTVTPVPSARTPGTLLTVEVTYTYPIRFTYLQPLFGRSFTLQSTFSSLMDWKGRGGGGVDVGGGVPAALD
jgi:Flp pilus assembly protein TadG